MRSTSGAQIEVLDDLVLKIGTDEIGARVGGQGAWIQRHALSVLPDVRTHWDHGYVMRRLEEVDWYTVDWLDLLKRHVDALREIWRLPAECEPDVALHVSYVRSLLEVEMPGFGGAIEPWGIDVLTHAMSFELRELPLCLTHGDATFDNVMRDGERHVLIDPLPARPEIPNLRAVDIAKICQSIHGYEHIKYGRPRPELSTQDVRDAIGDVTDDEWAAVEYLTAVHFLRLLRYESHLRPVFLQLFADLAFGWAYDRET